MGEDAIKLPIVKWEVPKPRPWDLIAVLAVVASIAVASFNLANALGGRAASAVSGGMTAAIVAIQLLICSVSLLILGKTAKHGTIWGNLAAVAGMFAGMSGILLAAALWTAA